MHIAASPSVIDGISAASEGLAEDHAREHGEPADGTCACGKPLAYLILQRSRSAIEIRSADEAHALAWELSTGTYALRDHPGAGAKLRAARRIVAALAPLLDGKRYSVDGY